MLVNVVHSGNCKVAERFAGVLGFLIFHSCFPLVTYNTGQPQKMRTLHEQLSVREIEIKPAGRMLHRKDVGPTGVKTMTVTIKTKR